MLVRRLNVAWNRPAIRCSPPRSDNLRPPIGPVRHPGRGTTCWDSDTLRLTLATRSALYARARNGSPRNCPGSEPASGSTCPRHAAASLDLEAVGLCSQTGSPGRSESAETYKGPVSDPPLPWHQITSTPGHPLAAPRRLLADTLVAVCSRTVYNRRDVYATQPSDASPPSTARRRRPLVRRCPGDRSCHARAIRLPVVLPHRVPASAQ